MNDGYVAALVALGHQGRLSVFRLLVRRVPDWVPAGELAEALSLKPSTLSVYVSILVRCGLIQSRREGRSILYAVDLDSVGDLLGFLVDDCCRGRPEVLAPVKASRETEMQTGQAGGKVFNVLFVCSGNSARSIFAEAILEKEGKGHFNAFSAGTLPASEVNPMAISTLQSQGYDTSALRPKNVDEFVHRKSLELDFVFTVCDHAANVDCPPLPGQPVTAHWGMPDPVRVEGTVAEKALAFQQAFGSLRKRLATFISLPFATLDRISLQSRLDDIGREAAEVAV
ncbi:helix-turn-helix domain-containing protein [Roseibium polysiphoniae]|uniref:Helix-turn-helix domain-containing protein n=1 Tax=Roseibium polysiphoniae TaxID=2571221 RepID=A0ABR9C9X0_9HYPH|nr:helix-turn-helix domain-containing protein [Roseibium polysiphoniae]MBD8876675.1 helix-turn-helix domain-containing protein [Roseibium polysiphoniae]